MRSFDIKSNIEDTQFFHGRYSYSQWTYCEKSRDARCYYIGADSGFSFHYSDELDALYPGFVAAVDLLYSIGFDRYSVTPVLKYCILQKDPQGIHGVLSRQGMINVLTVAAAINLDEPTLLSHLDAFSSNNQGCVNLPNDFSQLN